MSKEINMTTCQTCESEYKLVYDYKLASGEPKFCPFCASEIYSDDYEEFEGEE